MYTHTYVYTHIHMYIINIDMWLYGSAVSTGGAAIQGKLDTWPYDTRAAHDT